MSEADPHSVRIGHGYDLHRLEPIAPIGPGRPFILAGIVFDHPVGPVGHSDGDGVYHALTDALLGAIGHPDIGQLFPDDDPRLEAADSSGFLIEAYRRVEEAGYQVGNADITVICELPKIGPRKSEMITNLARLLHCESNQINVKGKTHEKLDSIGAGRAIEVHVVVLLRRMSS